jgi:hypothetical protein
MSSANHEDNANRRIDEELDSVDSLKHVLSTRCGCKLVDIHREQNDPPDFTVMIDGVLFPTEVTSIVSRQKYHAHCGEFAKAVCDRADSLGILSGKYAFIVSHLPHIPIPNSKNGRQLIDAAVSYVDATREQDASPKIQLAHSESGEISIEKVSAIGSIVYIVWTPPGMREGETQNQLALLIQQAVDDKKRKLQVVGIGSRRALLLLYDAFGYADPQDAVAAIQQVYGYDWFHSIFWAASFFDRKNISYPEEPGREGFFLFSCNPSWHRVGTVPLDTGA